MDMPKVIDLKTAKIVALRLEEVNQGCRVLNAVRDIQNIKNQTDSEREMSV